MSRRPLSFALSLSLGAALAGCTSAPPERAAPKTAEPSKLAEPSKPAESKLEDLDATTATNAPAPPASYALEKRQMAAGAVGMGAPVPIVAMMPMPMPPANRENYAHVDANPVHRADDEPVSTFSIDVDTGSYANVRRFLHDGSLPVQDAVRVEELVNYFDYAYAPPRETGVPFSFATEVAPTPWNPKTLLLHVGIQGWKPDTKPAGSNLVFLVDVSGSMSDDDKLPLVVRSLQLLADTMSARDRISLVVYAGASGVVLEPTSGAEKATIKAALDRLQAGGSTNGASGIELAYSMAKQGWIEGGVNRVMLATDGDFNVGVTDFEQLVDIVERHRKSGVALTTLGFGTGNYNDHLMERLADAGDGNYAYIDSAQEAQKVLVRQQEGTLETIARDVKIQVEFNPAVVSEYRLIGYENRMLAREDFNNDAVDAGDIGAGHTVTALYEVALAGSGGERIDALRYGAKPSVAAGRDEIAHLKLRYKRPGDGMAAASRLLERDVLRRDVKSDVASASPAYRMAASVAAFGQLLTGGRYTGTFDYTAVEQLAAGAGDDRFGERAEFRQLVRVAKSLAEPVGRVEKAVEAGG